MRPVSELKRRLARTPLWLRLVAATMLLVTLAIALTGLFAVQILRQYLLEQVDDRLRVASQPMRPGPDGPPSPARGERPQRLYGLFHMIVLDADGREVVTVAESTEGARPELPSLTASEVIRRAATPFTVDSAGTGPEWRVVALPARDGLTRVVAVSLGDVDSTLSRLTLIVAGVGGGVLVTLGFACHWVVRRSLRPLGEIERTAEAIVEGDLSRRVPPRHRRTEMGRLGRAINGMLAQIEKAMRDREASEAVAREAAVAARRSEERMRTFVADASHELRTPLTSIRGFAELYRQVPVAESAWLIERVEEEAARMGLLVDDLLLLASLDQRRPLEQRPVDLLSLAAGAVLDAQTLAADRKIVLARLDEAEGPVLVSGDEARLRQVIGNLVGNALRHTPAGTPVRVRVGVEGDEALLEVADEGPGLPEEDTERVFERFFRVDQSRSRNSPGGTGLGLSIVSALVKAHGGSITASSGPGAVFVVRLPSAR